MNTQQLKTVLITGASGAIGSALAEQYAVTADTLVLFGRNEDKLEQVAERCRNKRAQVITKISDMLDLPDFMEQLDQVCRDHCPQLVIVNAGVSSTACQNGEEWSAIEEVVRVNLLAAISTVQVVVPHLRQQEYGQIALISSLAAWYGLPVTPAYSATKAALKNYGEAIQSALAKDGILVTVVLPGFVESAMSRSVPGSKPFKLTAEMAARKIRNGLEAGHKRISFPFPLNLGCWLLAVLPPSCSGWLIKKFSYHA